MTNVRKSKKPLLRRQAILDYLNDHGESTAAEISKALGYEKRTVHNYMRDLRMDYEISTVERIVGKCMMQYHTAKVAKSKYTGCADLPKPSKEPWRTVHRGTDNDRPIPNQGGQGALRRTVFVGANTVYK